MQSTQLAFIPNSYGNNVEHNRNGQVTLSLAIVQRGDDKGYMWVALILNED